MADQNAVANEPEVTFIIVTFNSEKFIVPCIESINAITGCRKEIVVVDNYSSDATCELISFRFPEVCLIANTTNAGYAAAINQGIQKSTASYIVAANDDIVIDKNWFLEVSSVFNKYADCAMVASKVVYLDNPLVLNSAGIKMYPDLSAVNEGLDEIDLAEFSVCKETFGAYGACMIFKRALVDIIGLFEESYWLFREEDNYIWKMRLAGYSSYYAPLARVMHKRSAHTGLYSPLKLYYSERNRLLNVMTLFPWWYLFVSEFYSVKRYLLHFRHLKTAKNGSKKIATAQKLKPLSLVLLIAKAYCAAFWRLPNILRARKDIRRYRKISAQQQLALIKQFRATDEDILK